MLRSKNTFISVTSQKGITNQQIMTSMTHTETVLKSKDQGTFFEESSHLAIYWTSLGNFFITLEELFVCM